jgi:hypothetical protein
MQKIYSFGVSPLTYALRGKNNHFPDMKNCPICHHPEALEKHGFYWRNALFSKRQFRIPIRRLKCSSCGKTISFLPDYLLPYFQYCLVYILESLRGFFLQGKRKAYYQLLQFYRQRFLKNLNRIESFFRDLGYRGVIPEQEKAIKLLEMIRNAFPKAKTFAKRFQESSQTNFMAK